MSDIKISLVDFDGLSEPSKALIEKVSEAVGGVFKPYQIKRVANAEADAEMIKVKTEIKISELHQRAINRFVVEEALKQSNIENITRKALPSLNSSAQPNNIDKDWLVDFFDKSRLISNEGMQDLWSQILAGEANTPGTYSKRTIHLMATLDKSDAEIFMRLCSFVWGIGSPIPLIFDSQNEIYNNYGINFKSLKHLDTIGLISFESLAGYERKGFNKNTNVNYIEELITLEFPNESNNNLNVGKAIFTDAGLQLFTICKPEKIEKFTEYVITEWDKVNIKRKILSK